MEPISYASENWLDAAGISLNGFRIGLYGVYAGLLDEHIL